MKRMIFDTANILFRVAAANGKYHTDGSPEDRAGLAMHMSLNSFNKMYKQFKPDEIAVVFEGPKNWRKEYTRSEACRSRRVYKANRVRDSSMEPFFELISSFEELVRAHSNFVCLSHPRLEGDDLFAGYVQRHTANGDTVVGVSGDKDFVQLLKHPGFTLIDPATGKPRSLESVCGVDDAAYFMFEKTMRGDKGDNVFPAYPRVLKKRLQRCLTDEYELTKIMNETWQFTDDETGQEITHRVGDLFEENNLLMNLECQPTEIRALIESTLDSAAENKGKFSFFQFTKFCGKFGLKQIAENPSQFTALFSAAPQRPKSDSDTILRF